jgi:hypothetical protein
MPPFSPGKPKRFLVLCSQKALPSEDHEIL